MLTLTYTHEIMELEKTSEVIMVQAPIQCQDTSISSASDHLVQNRFQKQTVFQARSVFLNEGLKAV